jgi:L-threonylcarbamoyladenylate synthase
LAETINKPATSVAIARAAEIIKAGGLVSFPTETVYGLGANALNAEAVARIFKAKNRPSFDPLIVHVGSFDAFHDIAEPGELAMKLARAFWPGPLTLIVPKKAKVPLIVTSGLDTVGVRMPNHPVAKALLELSDCPIAAPSANPFGYISPTRANHVADMMGGKIDMILNGGECSIGLESTIIGFNSDGNPVLLRPGGLSVTDIEAVAGQLVLTNSDQNVPNAPGQTEWHYAPLTALTLFEKIDSSPTLPGRTGYLFFKKPDNIPDSGFVEVLSPTGDLTEAAANLFTCLFRLDQAGLDRIHAETVPEDGLGVAIMDRLIKASKRRRT